DSSDAAKGIFRFVSVGNLIPSKRMDLLIGSFAKVFKGNPGVSLTIYGGGPEREKLENTVYELGVSDQVKLMGQRPREEISSYLKSCDCFALASQSETFGVVYIEALACGVPVIAARSGGPESFINSSNGILVPVNDLDRFASALEVMYQNSGSYDHQRISEETLAQFSPEHVAVRLTEVYTRIVNMSKTHSAYGRRET
ncbi:MAG: glycosyltransferase, partial [Saccharofermentanales bacterium]